MQLKGFDSYDISLGDEMRGERASLGKTLEDVERDLRIKARMIVAIENCDLSGFANQSVIAGYVRSYARYLGMNADDCFERFCQESGYRSPAQLMSTSGDGSAFGSLSQPANSRVGTEIASSRFAAPPATNRFRARISLGALTSTMALVALICGLGYGGYALLQDIQRVDWEPSPDAPEVVADAPAILMPRVEAVAVARPDAEDYQGGGPLALSTPVELPPIEKLRRDGPISAIDPTRASLFGKHPVTAPDSPPIALDVPPHIREAAIDGPPPAVPVEAATAEAPLPEPERGIVVHAAETAWIRVRDESRATIWQGTLYPGDTYRLPERFETGDIRAGNPGGVFIFVDGVSYGPIGRSGQPTTLTLAADEVRNSLPQANPPDTEQASGSEILERAEARLKRP